MARESAPSPATQASEDLYQDEFDAGRAEDFKAQLAALERAEERLAAGTYGLSIVSGEPIPDARLEVVPTAERTVEEEAAGPERSGARVAAAAGAVRRDCVAV